MQFLFLIWLNAHYLFFNKNLSLLVNENMNDLPEGSAIGVNSYVKLS